MMTKQHLKRLWRRFHSVSLRYYLILFLLFGALAVLSLRQNNLTMARLRQEVYRADEQNSDVETALKNLREHVHAHMNTDLTSGSLAIYPPIQLKYRFERLVAAERERVAAVNARVYTDAQADCERRIPAGLSGGGRIPCVEEYVAKHGVKEQTIPEALYKFDFLSPVWSPDLAGFSLLAAIFFGALLLLRLLTAWCLKLFKNPRAGGGF